MIRVEVVFALPERQVVVTLDVPAGTTLREAVRRSGLAGQFPGLVDPEHMPMGVFGKREPDPDRRVLTDGDRIELYRPLALDPRVSRRERARRARRP